MKKKHQQAISAALSKALEPPAKRKPSETLNTLLSQYAPPPTPEKDEGLNVSAASEAGPVSEAGPAKMPLQALPEAGPATEARPVTVATHILPAPNLFASLPNVAGYLKLGNQIVDHLLPQLEPYEQIVYLQLYRLSHGNGKPFCLISMPKLARRTKISERSLWRTVAELDNKGLVKKNLSVHGKGKEQGISFWIAAPAGPATMASHAREAGPAIVADNKRKALKENNIKGEAPKINRLTPEELSEFVVTVRDLITDGETLEQVSDRFAPSLHPEDWVFPNKRHFCFIGFPAKTSAPLV